MSGEKIIKIEINLLETIHDFFNARALLKKEPIEKNISDFLERETKGLKESSFRDAIS